MEYVTTKQVMPGVYELRFQGQSNTNVQLTDGSEAPRFDSRKTAKQWAKDNWSKIS